MEKQREVKKLAGVHTFSEVEELGFVLWMSDLRFHTFIHSSTLPLSKMILYIIFYPNYN